MIKKQIFFNYIAACVAPEGVVTYKDEATYKTEEFINKIIEVE